MGLLNPLYALLFSVPFDWRKGCHQDKVNFKIPGTGKYRTLWNDNPTNHGHVLMVQSSLARMDMINFQDTSYRLKVMETFMELSKDQQVKEDHLRMMLGLLERATARFFCIGLLQNALQTNLQISIAGINWASSHSPDNQMLFSIVMCWMATIADWPDMAETIKILYKENKKVSNYRDDWLEDGAAIAKLRRTICW